MRRYARGHSDSPLYLGLALAAVLLGIGVSLIPAGQVLRALAAAVGVMIALRLTPSALAATVDKGRRFIGALRWWHGLWFAVFASGLVFRVRDIDAARDTPLDLWAAWRIGLVGLVALVLLSRLATKATDWAAGMLRGLPAGMTLCALTALVSTLWSVYPPWTLYKSVEYLVDLSLLAAVLTAVRRPDDLKSLFDLTWVMSGFFAVTIWLGVVLRPDLAIIPNIGLIGYQILGVFPAVSSNGVGDQGGILLLIAGTRLLSRTRQRGFYWLLALVGLVTVVLAQSRSPATGTLLGLLAVLLVARRYRLLALVGTAGAVLILMTGAGSVLEQAFYRGQSPEQFYGLSGRIGFWTRAWEIFQQNPLLGLGGYAGGRFVVLSGLGVTDASSLHNAWLEILLGVGLVGFLPFLATFLGVWRQLVLRLRPWRTHPLVAELRLEAIGLFVLLCFRSVFSVEFTWHPPLQFFLVLAFAELLRRTRAGDAGVAVPLAA